MILPSSWKSIFPAEDDRISSAEEDRTDTFPRAAGWQLQTYVWTGSMHTSWPWDLTGDGWVGLADALERLWSQRKEKTFVCFGMCFVCGIDSLRVDVLQ